jgi:hypothetical protein
MTFVAGLEGGGPIPKEWGSEAPQPNRTEGSRRRPLGTFGRREPGPEGDGRPETGSQGRGKDTRNRETRHREQTGAGKGAKRHGRASKTL